MEVSIDGASTYSQPVDYTSAGQYLFDTPEIHGPNRQILFGSAPGANVSYSTDLGFKNQTIILRVLYVDETDEAVLAQWKDDCDAMATGADATVGGIDFKRCFLDAQGSVNTPIQKVIVAGGAEMFAMYAVIKLVSQGDPN